MELVKYKKFVYIPEPEGQAKLSKANFVGFYTHNINGMIFLKRNDGIWD